MPTPSFVPLQFERLLPAEMRQRVVDFLGRMRTRRSVRHFSPEPIPLDVVRLAIEAAAQAPSGANRQPWRFVLVTDPEIKRRIRVEAEQEERRSYEQRMPLEWLELLEPLGTDWHKEFLEMAPALIVVFRVDRETDHEGRARKSYYAVESVGIATGFLIAALHLAGLATLTHTPSPMAFLSEVLGRPDGEKPFVLLPVGYPAHDCAVPDIRRKPTEEVLVECPPPGRED